MALEVRPVVGMERIGMGMGMGFAGDGGGGRGLLGVLVRVVERRCSGG
jgi:hypothetical protein